MTTLMTAFDGVQVPTRQDPVNFPTRGDDMMSRFPPFQEEINVITGEVNLNATAAAAAKVAAEAAAGAAQSVAGALPFNPATNYSLLQAAISLVNGLTYRRLTAGQSATDPANDSANWKLANPIAGFGGATASGSVTLTSTSAGAQAVTTTAYGQYVVLPDATTMPTPGAVAYTLRNVGPYPLGVKDNAGAVLGWVPPRACAMIGLADKSTAAGIWTTFGTDPAAITAAAQVSLDFSIWDIIAVDSNRSFILLHNGSSLYGMMYDGSTGTFGAATLIRSAGSSVQYAQAVLSAANQILVASTNNTTALEVVALTLSGVGIVVNTAATATLAASISANYGATGGFIALGTNFTFGYVRATAGACLRNVTVSGTTPVISAETTLTPTSMPAMFAVSGTVGIAFGGNGANHYAIPFSISGGVPTVGTQASWANTNNMDAVRVMGSRYLSLSVGTIGLVSVSGTVATVSTAAGGLAAGSSGVMVEGQISASKWFLHDAVGTARIATDTAGALSVTTFSTGVAFIGVATCLAKVNSSRAVLYGIGQVTSVDGSANPYYYYTTIELDVSGATASLVRTTSIQYDMPNGAALDAGFSNTISRPTASYSGLALMDVTSSVPTSPARHKYSGSPQILGQNADTSIIVGGLMAAKFDGAGVSCAQIQSLQLNPVGRNGDGASTFSYRRLNGIHINSRRVIGQTGAPNAQARTFYCVESIA